MKIVLTQENLEHLIRYGLVNKGFVNSTHKLEVKFSTYDKNDFATITILDKEPPTEPVDTEELEDLKDLPY